MADPAARGAPLAPGARMNRMGMQTELGRRGFVAGAVGAALASWLGSRSASADPPKAAELPQRRLGRTGASVSLLGLGGAHLGSPDEQEAIRIVRTAIDHGMTFMDNSWDYNHGVSEERMGKALSGGYRDRAFLMTKLDGRTKQAAAKQLDESLRRLRTDHVDLLQIHEVIRGTDPARVFADGGAIEAFVEAKKAGKTRFIGFTGHKSPEIHLEMLKTAFDHGFRFDTVQMPLNVMDAHYESFEKKVLPVLLQHDIGVLGMKSIGAGVLLRSQTVSAPECLRYALGLPTSVVITGCDSMNVLQQALAVGSDFAPMSADERTHLLARTAEAAGAGAYEKYKTSDRFDTTAHHPEWLESGRM
jgi:aryl-alcohol dehydrogenase-like predicted oxidoreductase